MICGNFLVVATTDRMLYALDLKTSGAKPVALTPKKLRRRVTVDLVSVAGSAIVTMDSGEVLRIDTKGHVLWRATVGGGVPTGSCLAPRAVLVATDEGMVRAISIDDGGTLWSQGGLGPQRYPPVVHGGSVFVVGSKNITALDLANGRRTKVVKLGETASCAPTAHGNKLFVGCRSGRVLVLDTQKLTPLYLLRGTGACTSPVTLLRDGTALTSFENKRLQAYRKLP